MAVHVNRSRIVAKMTERRVEVTIVSVVVRLLESRSWRLPDKTIFRHAQLVIYTERTGAY